MTTVVATPGQGSDRPQEVSYTDTKVIGNGSFGVVYQAKLVDTSELVAIKKVLQDKRFKVGHIVLCSCDVESILYNSNNCIPDAKRGYYGFIIVVVRVRRDFLLATYSPHFFPDFFHIWQVA